MSYTEIYRFTKKGNPIKVAEIKNAFRGAARVWDIVGDRYLGPFTPEWTKYLPADLKHDNYSRLCADMGENSEIKKVWALDKSELISEVDKIAMRSTFDDAICMFKDLPRLIKAFMEFEGDTSLPEQAEQLTLLLKSKNTIAVGWNQSSVGSFRMDRPYNFLTGKKHFDIFEDFTPVSETLPATTEVDQTPKPLTFTPKEDFLIPQESIDVFLGAKNKLLPCPCCETTFVTITGRKNRARGNIVLTVMCHKGVFECGLNLCTCVKDNPEEIKKGIADITKRWNTRPTKPIILLKG